MTVRIAPYVMKPAEDVVLFGGDLADGMLAMPEDVALRHSGATTEDHHLRAERFRRVTSLRPMPQNRSGYSVAFIGEWVDGYQCVTRSSAYVGWIVKRDSLPAPEPQPARPERRRWWHLGRRP